MTGKQGYLAALIGKIGNRGQGKVIEQDGQGVAEQNHREGVLFPGWIEQAGVLSWKEHGRLLALVCIQRFFRDIDGIITINIHAIIVSENAISTQIEPGAIGGISLVDGKIDAN